VSAIFNIYCDESCHLEHDHIPVMVLGAVWCPRHKAREMAERLRDIKVRNNEAPTFEAKWARVSPSRLQLYRDMVDYFFDDDDLHFRAIVVPDKGQLDHDRFNQDHDTFYYKMYFYLLRTLLSPNAKYAIYLDVKDTKSAEKTAKLHDVLCNDMYDFDRKVVERIQTVRSHEVEQLQLADLLIGAIGYANRGISANAAKVALIERIRQRSRYSLLRSTLFKEEKFNLFRWVPQKGGDVA